MHNSHHNHHDTFHDRHYPRLDHCAPDCDDQIPIRANMTRGLQGNDYRVEIKDDTDGLTPEQIKEMFADPESLEWFDYCDETYLEGSYYDHATKTWIPDWTSGNINGGRLHTQYNLRPFTIPQTYTQTWIYRRPGRTNWSFTGPATPYIWDTDGDGVPDVDGIVGAGVGNIYIREGINADWVQTERHGGKTPVPPQLPDSVGRWGQLNWPQGMEPRDFNGPSPTEAWAATLTFGYGGDIELPNLDDLAKILGWRRIDLEAWLSGNKDGLTDSNNVKDYIDKQDENLQQQITNIDERVTNLEERVENIENQITEINNKITQIGNKYDGAIRGILDKVYLGGTFNATTGVITWPNTVKIPLSSLNIFAANSSPSDATITNALRGRTLSDNDVRVV